MRSRFSRACSLRGVHRKRRYDVRAVLWYERWKSGLDALMNVVFALVALVLTWRLIEGGLGAYERSKRSMFLQLPDWWGYAIGAVSMLLWISVCLYVAWEGMKQARRR